MTCSNCGDDRARRKGLCDPCYQHKWRTGADRPESNVVKHGTRIIEGELMAKRLRQYRS